MGRLTYFQSILSMNEAIKTLISLAMQQLLRNQLWLSMSFKLLSKQGLCMIEPVREKTNNKGVRPGSTQTSLYGHRR